MAAIYEGVRRQGREQVTYQRHHSSLNTAWTLVKEKPAGVSCALGRRAGAVHVLTVGEWSYARSVRIEQSAAITVTLVCEREPRSTKPTRGRAEFRLCGLDEAAVDDVIRSRDVCGER